MKKKEAAMQKEEESKKLRYEAKWQTGDYSRSAEFRFNLPDQFLLLCKLMEVTPEQVLVDFMDNLACSSWKRQGRDEPKSFLVAYFISHGYGQHHYNEDDIRIIFKELDAIGTVWPADGKMKLIELSAKWRAKYQEHWFKKWHRKTRRKLA
jgi:hypothetical protein